MGLGAAGAPAYALCDDKGRGAFQKVGSFPCCRAARLSVSRFDTGLTGFVVSGNGASSQANLSALVSPLTKGWASTRHVQGVLLLDKGT